ncbi:MAG: hypothetical protein Q9173_004895 [Seirophora scorigena]
MGTAPSSAVLTILKVAVLSGSPTPLHATKDRGDGISIYNPNPSPLSAAPCEPCKTLTATSHILCLRHYN